MPDFVTAASGAKRCCWILNRLSC